MRAMVGLVLLLLLWGPTPASAQPAPGPPIPLIPPEPPPSAMPPAPVPPLPASPALTAPSPSPPKPITGKPLPSLASGWSGPAAPEHALPADFWRDTPRALAEILLARLPDTTSMALQSLERRLLLSPAAAPQGPDAPGLSLPALRAAALLRLGEIDAARAVLAAMPDSKQNAGLRLAVAADALAGQRDRACATVARAIRADQDAFWQRELIACQALDGKTEEARLGLQLLAEEKLPAGKVLAAAIDAVGAPPAAIARLDHPTPLLLRLAVKARLSLDPRLIATLSPDLALALALDKAAPAAIRLAAAERAARLGALPPARLAALYTSLAGTSGADPAFAQARRFAAIAKAAGPGDQIARIIAFARDFAGPGGDGLTLAARMVMPQLHAVAPDPALASAAASVARLALAAGAMDLARRWSALSSGAERRKLDFVLALAASDKGSTGNTGAQDVGPPALRIALLAALGRPIPAQAWPGLPARAWSVGAPPGPPLAPWLALSATPEKQIGATVLASLLFAGATGKLSHDPLVLNAAIRGIERAGLDVAARRIAVEAALATDP